MVHKNVYDFPIGKLCIAEDGQGIISIDFISDEDIVNVTKETAILAAAHKQLSEYFLGKRTDFSLPLHPVGTPFQMKVWEVLSTIPYGKTLSYKEIAIRVGNPKASRAVGMANNRNPIPILIPCHRVIGANGKLIGYAGGLPIKEMLLSLEQNTVY